MILRSGGGRQRFQIDNGNNNVPRVFSVLGIIGGLAANGQRRFIRCAIKLAGWRGSAEPEAMGKEKGEFRGRRRWNYENE